MPNNLTGPLIITYPAILGRKPVIAGTRISVQLILEKIRDGWTLDELLADYPFLKHEQITAALAYAASVLGLPYSS